jgi:hypothetical protein
MTTPMRFAAAVGAVDALHSLDAPSCPRGIGMTSAIRSARRPRHTRLPMRFLELSTAHVD